MYPNANQPVFKTRDMGKYKYDAQKQANTITQKQTELAIN